MKTEIQNCLARVLNHAGQVTGAGFLVGNSHVITCAHVVNHSFGRSASSGARPAEKVTLDFPYFNPSAKATAKIVGWNPIRSDGSGDVAVLKLDAETNKLGAPVLLVEAEPEELEGHEFETYGFPIGNDTGGWAHGRLLGERPDGSIQLEGRTDSGGYRIQSGFSGAPVLDVRLNSLVGMVVAAERQADAKTAFMLPTRLLIQDHAELEEWISPPYPQAIRAYMEKVRELYKENELETGSYVSLPAKIYGQEEIPDAVQHLRNILSTKPSSSILVLGDYGSGKTKLAFKLSYELADEAIRSRMRTTIPFYINLSFPKGRKLTSAIPDYLKRYNIHLAESDLLYIMNHRANIVFILDGFDEMANRTKWGEVPNIVETLSNLRVASGIRTVITSRTTFFRDKIEEKVVKVDARVSLLKLGDEGINEYFQANSGVSQSAVDRLFRHYPEIRELCRVPINVFMLSKHLSALSDMRKDDIKSIDLYDLFIERNLLDNADTFPEWPPGERRKFIQKLAYRWFKDEIFEILAGEMQTWVRSELPSVTEERLQELTMYLLNCSLFIRIENNYRFNHYSFVEYLVAEILVEDLYAGRLERWQARTLYAELFDFMSQLIQRRGVGEIPIDKIVATQNEAAQSNLLATMYRDPVPGIKPYFERLLIEANHDLVRCLACQGLGLYETVDAALLREAFRQERNSIIKSILRGIAEQLADSAISPSSRDDYQKACVGKIELEWQDAEQILKTNEALHSLNGYRKALRVGDKRWTTTIGAIYLLAVIRDKPTFAEIRELASSTKLPAIKKAYSEIEHLLK